MKQGFNLFTKILLWFFLNLAVVFVILAGAYSIQFQVGPDSLLRGITGDQVTAVGVLMADDLREKSASEWDSMLDRFSEAYDVDFILFTLRGKQVAGLEMDLPEKVRQKFFREGNRLVPPQRPAPLPRDYLDEKTGVRRPPPQGYFPPPPAAGRRPPQGQRPLPSTAGRRPPPNREHEPLLSLVRTTDPTRYWMGIGVPLPASSFNAPGPGVLIAVSNSITGNGLFFDPMPWLLMIGIVIIVSTILWFPLVRNLTKSIAELTLTAENIAVGNFDTRARQTRNDELGRLGQAIDEMSTSLESHINGQKRFLGDVAHELASPIARIKLALSILEQKVTDRNVERVSDLIQEVEQMSDLVAELLSFTRAQIKPSSVELAPVELADVVRRVVERETKEEDTIEVDVPTGLLVLADGELLARALANVLRNAVRYSGTTGPIEISAERRQDEVRLVVSDHGPGVAEENLGKLFEPFYRPENSRSRELGGAGLGLAIVRSCVQICGGTVKARNLSRGGLAVIITLKIGTN
jgi:signal transduction histidine kinase